MGRIACCNVLSDLYAMGVRSCDNMLMLLGVSSQMSDEEKKAAIPLMMRGFSECASEAGTSVQGGQTVVNPWLIIGGVATAVCPLQEIIMPHNACIGDLLVLTKPLGTQIAVNAYQWMVERDPRRYEKVSGVVSDEQIVALFERATAQMAQLNKRAAELLHKHGAHACTDVTGFGILGHASNLAKSQLNAVDLVLESLPCLEHAVDIDDVLSGALNLRRGTSPETSGGLLVALGERAARQFVEDMRVDGADGAWVVGRVEPGDRVARLAEGVRVLGV